MNKNLGTLTVAGAAVLVSLLGSSAATASTAGTSSSQAVAAAMPGATRPPYARASHSVGLTTQRITAYNGCDQTVWFKVRIAGRRDTGWIKVNPDGFKTYAWARWKKLQRVDWYWRGCDLL